MENSEKPECQLIGQDGNVFNLIGITRKTLRRANLCAELETFDCELADLQKSKDSSYDSILLLIMKYVDVV